MEAPELPDRHLDSDAARRYRDEGWWSDLSLAQRVATHARERPDEPAFVTLDDRLSWKGYHQSAGRLASALINAGLRRGDRVAVLLPDCPAVHVAYLANEMAGLVTVGIGARAGRREIGHILSRARALALVSFAVHRGVEMNHLVAEMRSAGISLSAHIVVGPFEKDLGSEITVDRTLVGTRDASLNGRALGPDDLFMINSTSGTTGLPKLVAHSQNRFTYINAMAVLTGEVSADDVFLGAVPAPFGFGLWTAHFTPAILGAATVLMDRFSAEGAAQLIERERVTVLTCVSTQFIMVINSDEAMRKDLSSLRVMYTGGEAVPFEAAEAFERATGATVLQFYGSNESGIATGTRLGDPAEVRLRTAGRELPGTDLRLFDSAGELAAGNEGQPGSRGPATCLGYLDDPEGNARLITSDGFFLHADVCTIGVDGNLTLIGRTADIIIRGGKNISAAQVEAEVGAHPLVALAAAVALPDPVFGERVCVFTKLRRAGVVLELTELVRWLQDRGVSSELLPETLVVMDELPRSSGGKVAKGELRSVARSMGEAQPTTAATSGRGGGSTESFGDDRSED